MAFTYFQHGRRHHPKYGTDPIKGAGITNDFAQASGAFVAVASDGGAPASPSFVAVAISLDKQSDAGDIYFITTGSPDYLTIAEPGFYIVTALATFAAGLAGYIDVAPVIGGDAWLGANDVPGFVPASFAGTGGGVARYRIPIQVEDTAVVGTATEVGVYPSIWHTAGSPQSGIAYIQVERLT